MNETNILSIFGNFSVVRTEARELQHTLSEMNGIKYEKFHERSYLIHSSLVDHNGQSFRFEGRSGEYIKITNFVRLDQETLIIR